MMKKLKIKYLKYCKANLLRELHEAESGLHLFEGAPQQNTPRKPDPQDSPSTCVR